jgi:hypothetical protein
MISQFRRSPVRRIMINLRSIRRTSFAIPDPESASWKLLPFPTQFRRYLNTLLAMAWLLILASLLCGGSACFASLRDPSLPGYQPDPDQRGAQHQGGGLFGRHDERATGQDLRRDHDHSPCVGRRNPAP